MAKAKFKGQLIEGHKGVTAVLVPFDPEEVWREKPVKLAGRRFGWLVKGKANGAEFDGYVGCRWGRFFVTISEELREAAKLNVGDDVELVLDPTMALATWKIAVEQSKSTTQPSKPRADAIELGEQERPARRKAIRR